MPDRETPEGRRHERIEAAQAWVRPAWKGWKSPMGSGLKPDMKKKDAKRKVNSSREAGSSRGAGSAREAGSSRRAGSAREAGSSRKTDSSKEVNSSQEAASSKETNSSKKAAWRKSAPVYVCAFLIPFVVMFTAFVLLKVYPFGDRQILTIDAWHQYYPFLVELGRKLKSGESLLYCWRMGMGSGFAASLAYYLASPLNFLVVLFPDELLREAFTLFILIKTGLAGAFSAFALRRMNVGKSEGMSAKASRGEKKEREEKGAYGVLIFSSLYALCSWNIGYYWNTMWLDSFALFPLVALGIYLLVREGKYKLYTLSLAAAVLANYYIGFMICIFTALFFFTLCFANKDGMRELAKKLKRIILFSALALMMAAPAILPTILALQDTYQSKHAPAGWQVTRGWLEALSGLFAYLKPTSTGGRPYIYCGILCVILLPAFCRLPRVSAREKKAYAAMILFLFVSTNVNVLNYVWHGFHATNSIPYRYTFMLSFLMVLAAYRAYSNAETLREKDGKVICVSAAAYYALTALDMVFRYQKENGFASALDGFRAAERAFWLPLLLNLVILAADLLLLLLLIGGKLGKTVFTAALAVVVGLEMIPTALMGTEAIGTTARENYPDRYEAVEAVIDSIEESESDNDFYRTELAARHGWNGFALYGYNGVSCFSSTMNVAVSNVFESMGLCVRQSGNRRHYINSTPVNNLFLNLKYLIARGSEVVNREYLTEAVRADDVYAYRNEAYLPVGFMVESGMADFAFEGDTPFEMQNRLLRAASGIEEDVFKRVEVYREAHQALTVTETDYGRYHYALSEDRGEQEKGRFEYSYEAPEDGSFYAFVDLKSESNAESNVRVEFQGSSRLHVMYNNGCFFPAGTYKAGDVFSVWSELGRVNSGDLRIYVGALDQDVFDRACELLQDEALEVTEFASRSLKGTIRVKKDGLMYTSIPCEKGWKVYVDGKRAELVPVLDAFIGVRLPEGEHTVAFVYSPDHVYLAVFLSFLGLGIFVLTGVLPRIRQSDRNPVRRAAKQ